MTYRKALQTLSEMREIVLHNGQTTARRGTFRNVKRLCKSGGGRVVLSIAFAPIVAAKLTKEAGKRGRSAWVRQAVEARLKSKRKQP